MISNTDLAGESEGNWVFDLSNPWGLEEIGGRGAAELHWPREARALSSTRHQLLRPI